MQSRRDRRAAVRLLRKLLKWQGKPPPRLVTDKTEELQCNAPDDHATMTPNGTRTIEPKSHTNQPGSENDRCDGSSLHDNLNSSFPYMVSF